MLHDHETNQVRKPSGSACSGCMTWPGPGTRLDPKRGLRPADLWGTTRATPWGHIGPVVVWCPEGARQLFLALSGRRGYWRFHSQGVALGFPAAALRAEKRWPEGLRSIQAEVWRLRLS